jgi:hypothetical protein
MHGVTFITKGSSSLPRVSEQTSTSQILAEPRLHTSDMRPRVRRVNSLVASVSQGALRQTGWCWALRTLVLYNRSAIAIYGRMLSYGVKNSPSPGSRVANQSLSGVNSSLGFAKPLSSGLQP